MPSSSDAEFEHAVLDMIEHSSTGSVPRTPSYDEILGHLRATHQVYASADHRDGHVTARSLAHLPVFHAANLDSFAEGAIAAEALEPNTAIFDRYVQSLPADARARAESCRESVAGRLIHHRPKQGAAATHDPVATLFLVPGGGPHPGLPGNYLHGMLMEANDSRYPAPWRILVKDSLDDVAILDAASVAEAVASLKDLFESAPFHLVELEALGFRIE